MSATGLLRRNRLSSDQRDDPTGEGGVGYLAGQKVDSGPEAERSHGFRGLLPDLVTFQEASRTDDYDQALDVLGPGFYFPDQAEPRSGSPLV